MGLQGADVLECHRRDIAVGNSAAMRSSVGVGLIWDSPLGPLRFDFAYALTKQPYDKTQFFRFSGGTPF